MRPSRITIFLTLFLLFGSSPAMAERNPSVPVTHIHTDGGQLGLGVTNLGYFGTAFSSRSPSARYPIKSAVEHVYRGGLWVGARDSDGTLRVSTGAQDANGLAEGDALREFDSWYLLDYGDTLSSTIWSNDPNRDNFDLRSLATQHIEYSFKDNATSETGNHKSLGLLVYLRVFSYEPKYADDFVILDYAIINNNVQTQKELRDIYLGLWVDTTVGNTDVTNPYDAAAFPRWDYNDDMNGAWGPKFLVPEANQVPGDPNIWMAYEHDADGEDGQATSWIGYRLLGTSDEPQPEAGINPVSYNQWRFRGVPEKDDWYADEGDPDVLLPGKYQIMSNGAFTVGETQETDYSRPSNWVGLISTGPFPSLAAEDTLRLTFAMVAGRDSLEILDNSKIAQLAYDNGFSVPGGPPSPVMDITIKDNSVDLAWVPGDTLDADGYELPPDSPLRQPEHHISDITSNEDFQGYRIYRYLGDPIEGDPYDDSQMVAQFDVVDGIGFDTGLPPLNAEGKREFTDNNLTDGFPYWYSVTSFSAENVQAELDEFESGHSTNATLIYPGSPVTGPDNQRAVGVYPNPYRAGSMFDDRTGEQEIGRKIWFTGLPARCRIQVFTLAGDVVTTLYHDDPSTGQESWDLLSDYTRTIASGLYIYVVENQDTGEVQRGKLVIIK